jgi:hypothetical protein
MSAHLRNADCSPPQAQPAAGVAIFFLGKFNYFLIKKNRVACSVFLVTGRPPVSNRKKRRVSRFPPTCDLAACPVFLQHATAEGTCQVPSGFKVP